ncbi:MAG TPA: PadR family transcriptional regulator [Terriglobales bacterium]|nr:PadR family transcriptional regulator [Terriglobales bacterium]
MPPPSNLLPGTLEMLVLKAVSLGELHGYGILRRIHQFAGGAFLPEQGALYPALYRLVRQGYLQSRWGTSEANRRARYYRLTAAGRRKLGDEVSGWNRLVGAMQTALDTKA